MDLGLEGNNTCFRAYLMQVFLKSQMVIHITVIKNTVSSYFYVRILSHWLYHFPKVPCDVVLFRFFEPLKNKAKAG